MVQVLQTVLDLLLIIIIIIVIIIIIIIITTIIIINIYIYIFFLKQSEELFLCRKNSGDTFLNQILLYAKKFSRMFHSKAYNRTFAANGI